MKILTVNYSDSKGGAARAAFTLHRHLNLMESVKSQMLVCKQDLTSKDISSARKGYQRKLTSVISRISRWANLLYEKDNEGTHSPCGYDTNLSSFINNSDADIVHLHWINNGMLSIPDISRINKPLVWTLHDMWAFCGAEHYTLSDRWIDGYYKSNRSKSLLGLDVNRMTWEAKKRWWREPIQLIAPSSWLCNCIQQSSLLSHWPVIVIPNITDAERWKPILRKKARRKLRLDDNDIYLLFVSAANTDPRKGLDLLIELLERFNTEHKHRIKLLIVGDKNKEIEASGVNIIYLGYISDDETMNYIYASSNVVLISSRQDNLPNVALEAQFCGIPVIAFRVGGLGDIVIHNQTGYLAEPFNCGDFSAGVSQFLKLSLNKIDLSRDISKNLRARFSTDSILKSHLKIYDNVLKKDSLTSDRR